MNCLYEGCYEEPTKQINGNPVCQTHFSILSNTKITGKKLGREQEDWLKSFRSEPSSRTLKGDLKTPIGYKLSKGGRRDDI